MILWMNKLKYAGIAVVVFLFFVQNSFSQNKKIRIACVGNSVTYGFTLKDPSAESYPAKLQQLLGDKFEVGNFGHSGATLTHKGYRPYYKTKEFSEALQFRPDAAVIELGVNDTDPRTWPNDRDDFESDYHWLIDTLRAINPKMKIYITRLLPVFEDHPRFLSSTFDWYWQVQHKIEAVAKANKVALIDTYTPFADRPDLITDAWTLHPNAKGYAFLAKVIYKNITGDFGGLKMPGIFGDNMVLQRGKPLPVWGTANPRDRITVSFNHLKKTCIADINGEWKTIFPEMKASIVSQIMRVSDGKTMITYNNILIGDVWFCSGQSNMYLPLSLTKDPQRVIAEANKEKNIRLFKFKPVAETDDVIWDSTVLNKINELEYFSGEWKNDNTADAKSFSAVGYYFGQKIQQETNVPIGLIELAVGGSPQLSWMDRYTLQADPLLENALKSDWRTSDFLMGWCRERADKNLQNTTFKQQRHPYQPCYNYDAGVSKIIQFPVKGVVWYQGESDADNAELYAKEFPLFIKSWREKWGYDFPFYYVQLSGLNRRGWPYFRDMQRKLLSDVPNSGMVVTSDLGDSLNVHYTDKKSVGTRLADLALYYTYHQNNIVPNGPMVKSVVKKGNILEISFAEGIGLKTADGRPLRGFKLENEFGGFIEAHALIQNDKVYIFLPKDALAKKVVYAWEGFPHANLVNGAELPASTFMMDIK